MVCLNGEEKMPIVTSSELCTGCGACVAACPRNCISMSPDAWGFLYPQVDAKQCVKCGLCQNICPLNANAKRNGETSAYSVCNKEDKVRLTSSSGGVFTILAEHVINNRGIVFGVGFDENWNAINLPAENETELKQLRGAKYVQSSVGGSYQMVKKCLLDGRMVLFSGTPCQIGGLKAYLGKEYENLICQDIICHGVPAPGAWRKYLDVLEKRAGAPAREVFFRSKERGWKNYLMSIIFENGKKYRRPPVLDPYMRAFLADLCLRPSCYQCRYKGINRQADITLADFWGVQHIQPKMDDNKGTSLVLIHSEKGEHLLRHIYEKAKVETIQISNAIQYNPAAVKTAEMPECYNAFREAVCKKGLFRAVEQFNKIPFVLRLKLEVYELLCRRKNRG